MQTPSLLPTFSAAAGLALLLAPPTGAQVEAAGEVPLFTRWTRYGPEQGLASQKVLAVLADGEDVWAGTDAGLCRLRGERFETITPEHGLAHSVVTSLALSERTGDLWIGTMGGLSRWSAGRIDTFDQLSSGLINDVIYAVTVVKGEVWVATASGVSVYDPDGRRWRLYNHENTVMHEPWCYWITASEERVFVAAWGGGVIEHDPARGTWKAYRDPDGEMEIDLFRDDGLVHDVTSSVAYADGVLWVGTYFGLSRYDGRSWRSYLEHDSGLPSNFINAVVAHDGWAWLATDDGLAAFDGQRWVVYRREEAGGSIRVQRGADDAGEVTATSTAIAHNFVNGVAHQDGRIWVATAAGLSLGTPSVESGSAPAPRNERQSNQQPRKGPR